MTDDIKRPFTPKINNNIAPLKKTKHLKLVKFDLDSPKMAEAIKNLGLIHEDLNTKLTKEDFAHIDPKITDLRFKHYQRQLLDTINQVLTERKRLHVHRVANAGLGD